MKVLFVVPSYVPAWRTGGPVVSIHSLARHIVQLGHPVTVITTNDNGGEVLNVPLNEPAHLDGVEVWYYPIENLPMPWPLSRMGYFSKSWGFSFSPRQRQAVRERVGKFDVVSIQNPFAYANIAGAFEARSAGVPYMYYARGMLQPSHLKFRAAKKRLYMGLFEKRILRHAAGLFALTEDEAAAYRLLGLETPTYVIPNAVDLSGLCTTVVDPTAPLIRQLEGKAVILYLSRIHPTKGVDVLVEAFVELAARHPSAVLVVAGPDEGDMVSGFEARLNQAALAGRVLFPGLIAGAAKRDLLARADVFVLPSHMEGFSMSVLEAMGSGVPVVITPGCHFPDVERARAGLIVEPRVRSMVEALDKLLASESLRRDMGGSGRRLVHDQYQWSKVAQRTVEAYGRAAAMQVFSQK